MRHLFYERWVELNFISYFKKKNQFSFSEFKKKITASDNAHKTYKFLIAISPAGSKG